MNILEYLYIGEIQYLDEIDLDYGWNVGDRVYIMDVDQLTCYCVSMNDSSICSWLDAKQIKLVN